MTIGSQTLAYPFLTVQRRLECTSDSQYLQKRGTAYSSGPSSFLACLKDIYKVENLGNPLGTVKTLYRGYAGYMFAITFWMSTLPMATEILVSSSPY